MVKVKARAILFKYMHGFLYMWFMLKVRSIESVLNVDKNAMQTIGIDYNEGVKRFSGNAAIYEKFLLKFLDDTTFEELDQAMQNRDYGTAFSAAHTLKGVTGNLSMNRLYEELVAFVEMLRNSTDLESAIAYYPKIKKTHLDLVSQLKSM